MKQRTYSASDTTKHALAASLKHLMAQKPLQKITIQEIADGCHMKRQNFYYHFEDIYDLVRWMFQEEAISLIANRLRASTWQDGLLHIFEYLQENRAVCLCALKSMGREHLKRFFHDDLYVILNRAITDMMAGLGASDRTDDVEFLTHFFVTALSASIESWLLGDISYSPQELVARTDVFLTDHFCGLSMRLKEERLQSS